VRGSRITMRKERRGLRVDGWRDRIGLTGVVMGGHAPLAAACRIAPSKRHRPCLHRSSHTHQSPPRICTSCASIRLLPHPIHNISSPPAIHTSCASSCFPCSSLIDPTAGSFSVFPVFGTHMQNGVFLSMIVEPRLRISWSPVMGHEPNLASSDQYRHHHSLFDHLSLVLLSSSIRHT